MTANHTLSSVDPVVSSVCPANGLEVNPGVLLDLGENTIRGSGGGDGIFLHSALGPGIEGGTVHNGTVRGFRNGIRGVFIDGQTLTALTVAFNQDVGISLDDEGSGFGNNNNVITHNSAIGNGSNGIRVRGNENEIERNSCSRNGSDGVVVLGNDNTLTTNRCELNSERGVLVSGRGNLLIRNLGARNGNTGVFVIGTANELLSNQGRTNQGDGVIAIGSGNITNRRNYGTGNASGENCSIDGTEVNDNYC